MTVKGTSPLDFARMLIENGDLDPSLSEVIERAEYLDDEDARARVEAALDEYRAKSRSEDSVSGMSVIEMLADLRLQAGARSAARIGGLSQFLERKGIIGTPKNVTKRAEEIAGKLGTKYAISRDVLLGMAHATDNASAPEEDDEAWQVAQILVGKYNDLLSRFTTTGFHPGLARAICDIFFGHMSFFALQKLRAFGGEGWKGVTDKDKIGALAVFALDQVYTKRAREIEATADALARRIVASPEGRRLTEDDILDMAQHASIAGDETDGMETVTRMLAFRKAVEEEFDGTVFYDSTNEIVRIAQFAHDEEDAMRIADLVANEARRLSLPETASDIGDEDAMRLAVIAQHHAARTGAGDIEAAFEQAAKNFMGVNRLANMPKAGTPKKELLFKVSPLPDGESALSVFGRGRQVIDHVGRALATLDLEPREAGDILLAIVDGISFDRLDKADEANDHYRSLAFRMARRILGEQSQPGAVMPIRPSKTPRVVASKDARQTAPPKPEPEVKVKPDPIVQFKDQLAAKYNFSERFLGAVAEQLSETHDAGPLGPALAALIELAAKFLRDEFGARPEAAYAMVQEHIAADPIYIERASALPLDDSSTRQRVFDKILKDVTTDVVSSMLEDYDERISLFTNILSWSMGAQTAARLAHTILPAVGADEDLDRFAKNHAAAVKRLERTPYREAVEEVLPSLDLSGDERSSAKSAFRFTVRFAALRSKPQIMGLPLERALRIYNIALATSMKLDVVNAKALELVGTYLLTVENLKEHGMGESAEELAMLICPAPDIGRALSLAKLAFSLVIPIFKSLWLGDDVARRLAGVVCLAIAKETGFDVEDPDAAAKNFAPRYLERYRTAFSFLTSQGVEEHKAVDIAIRALSTLDDGLATQVIEREIAKLKGGDGGEGEGSGSPPSPAANGSAPGAPAPPIMRASGEAVFDDDTKVVPTRPVWNTMQFPGMDIPAPLILGAQMAISARPFA